MSTPTDYVHVDVCPCGKTHHGRVPVTHVELALTRLDLLLGAYIDLMQHLQGQQPAEHSGHDIHGPVLDVYDDGHQVITPDCACPPDCADCEREGIDRD